MLNSLSNVDPYIQESIELLKKYSHDTPNITNIKFLVKINKQLREEIKRDLNQIRGVTIK